MAYGIINCDQERATRLTRKLIGNMSYLTDEDLDVIEFLSQKGHYSDKKAIIVTENSINTGKEFNKIYKNGE